MISNKQKDKIREMFNERFTVKGEGEYFFDIVENRDTYPIDSRKPTPKEIIDFILSQLDSLQKNER